MRTPARVFAKRPCFVCVSVGTMEYDLEEKVFECRACGVRADRRAVRAALYGSVEERQLVEARDHFLCRYCGRHACHLDHVFPLSRGGAPEPENLVCACLVCGSRKGNQTLEEIGMTLLAPGTALAQGTDPVTFPDVFDRVRARKARKKGFLRPSTAFTSHDARLLARVEHRAGVDATAHVSVANRIKAARHRVLVDYFAWKENWKKTHAGPPSEEEISCEFQRLWKLHDPSL